MSSICSCFLQNFGGFLVLLDESGTIDYVSENVSEFAPQCHQRDMIGKNLSDFVHRGDHKKIRHFLSRKKSGLPSREEVSTVAPPSSGSRQFFHFRLSEQAAGDNEFNHVSITGRYKRMGECRRPKVILAFK